MDLEEMTTLSSERLSIGNRISEYVARSELEAMERDARFSFFYQRLGNSESQSVKTKDRQEEAVNQALRESSANFEVVVMQEFQSLQNRYEGRMEENERRVTQVIGSAARDALRGQRNQMLHEVPVLLEAGQGRRKSS